MARRRGVVHRASPAKVNLSLAVDRVDETGLHPVDTVIHLLDFGDDIFFEPSDGLSVTCTPSLVLAQEDNLAYRAACAMSTMFGQDINDHIHIEKRIPHGAGMGGGSSNAATVISEYAQRWGVDRSDRRVQDVARSLGSDVAVFLAPTTHSRMTGYGDVLAESPGRLADVDLVMVMVPDAHASTPAVYRMFDEIGAGDRVEELRNDLAYASMKVCPDTETALTWIRAHRLVRAAQVSGSGAAVLGLTRSSGDAQQVAKEAHTAGLWSVATALRTAHCDE